MKINKVALYTSNLNETKDFYMNLLGFQCIDSYENKFTIKVGSSLLEFLESKKELKPFYHFAFNIPSNQFKVAKEWARSKLSLLIEDGDDEVYFEFLDAHSFYFLDPSGNIVEFIARHSVSENRNEAFSAQSVIDISEINITTEKVIEVGQQLRSNGISVRDGKELTEGLNFMGAGGCFLLLGPPNRRWFFSDKDSKSYPVTITIDQRKIIDVSDIGEVQIKTF